MEPRTSGRLASGVVFGAAFLLVAPGVFAWTALVGATAQAAVSGELGGLLGWDALGWAAAFVLATLLAAYAVAGPPALAVGVLLGLLAPNTHRRAVLLPLGAGISGGATLAGGLVLGRALSEPFTPAELAFWCASAAIAGGCAAELARRLRLIGQMAVRR